MSTETTLQSEFESVFLDDDFFGESVVYTQNDIDHTINAVIYRPGLKEYRQQGGRSSGSNQTRYHCEVRISRNAKNGIATIKEKSDSISLPLHLGDEQTVFRVAAIIAQDKGTWHLGLNK